MTYNEAIKGGVRVVNRNWQLVLIQLSVVFISSIGFFIIVGIPLAIAFIIFGVELLSVVFVFFIIYQFTIKKKGKRFTLQISMMLAVISLPFTLIIGNSTGGFILLAFAGAGVAGYYLFPYIVYADFAQKDEIMTGEGRAGFYTSFPSIPLNGMQAFSAFLWGFIFSLPSTIIVPGTTDLVSEGYLIWGPVAALFIFLSVLVLFKVNIDPDFDALKAEYSVLEEEVES